MIGRGLRGGKTQVSTKMAKANNRYMGELFDEHKPSSYINYLDANHLYGMVMPQNLPLKNLKWMDKIPTEKDILSYDEGSKGYILEVDFLPKKLHDLHADYPLAPEVVKVDTSMLSEYQLDLYNKSTAVIKRSQKQRMKKHQH